MPIAIPFAWMVSLTGFFIFLTSGKFLLQCFKLVPTTLYRGSTAASIHKNQFNGKGESVQVDNSPLGFRPHLSAYYQTALLLALAHAVVMIMLMATNVKNVIVYFLLTNLKMLIAKYVEKVQN